MQETVLKLANNTKDKWNGLRTDQKVKLIAIAAALLLALSLTVYLSTRQKWTVVEANKDYTTISKIQNSLNGASIKNRVVQNGTAIEVPEKMADQAMINLAENNIYAEGFTYQDSLDANSIGVSESDKKQMYVEVKRTEIASRLEMIDGVEKASVSLVLPSDDNYFSSIIDEARASVTLKTSKEITKDQARTMARLVEMSIKGLEAKNIEITDDRANSLYSGAAMEYGSLSSQDEIEKQKMLEIDTRIRAALAGIYDDIKVIPNVKIDWNKQTQSTREVLSPFADDTAGIKTRESNKTESVVNNNDSAQPGLGTNNNVAPNYATGDGSNSTYDAQENTAEYDYNIIEKVIEDKGGVFIPGESSVAIFASRNKIYNEKDLKAANVINADMTWPMFKEQNADVQTLEIDPTIVQSLQTGTGIINLTVMAYEKPIFVDEVVKPLAIEQIILLAILTLLLILLAYGLIKKTKPDEIEEIEPELSVEDLLVSTQLEEEEEQSEAERLAQIGTVESEFKKQIEKFVDEKPEAVAQLLRNWLSDEWEG